MIDLAKIKNFLVKKNWIYLIYLGLILFTLWNLRFILGQKFDYEYHRQFFTESQWRVSFSKRVMGDGELYRYSASELIRGADPFVVNPETPVFGKYLIGLSILLFNNAYLVNLPIWLITLGLLMAISHLIFKSQKLIFWAGLLFLLEPLVVNQLSDTGLDLTQTMLLLAHVYLMLKILASQKPSWKLSILAGVSLGWFSATKIAPYLPLIILVDAFSLYLAKRLKLILAVVVSLVLAYVSCYAICFFKYDYSPLSWLKAELWVINFYRISQVKASIGMVLVTMSSGFFKLWSDPNWRWQNEWSLIWLLGTISLVINRRQFYSEFKQKIFVYYLAMIFGSLFLVDLLVPFWPRYLLMLWPLFLLLVLSSLKKSPWLLGLLVLTSLILNVNLQFTQPKVLAQRIVGYCQNQATQEIKRYLSSDNSPLLSVCKNKNQSLEIFVPLVWPWQNQLSVPAKLTNQQHETIGNFTLEFNRINNQWLIKS